MLCNNFIWSTAILTEFWAVAWAHSISKSCNVTTQYLRDAPYDNYFYSDCNVDAQVIVTSPLPESNLSIIGPRLIIAWPAGNSGICTFFQPVNGVNGSLAIQLVNSTTRTPLTQVVETRSESQYPAVGVEGVLSFNTTTKLTLAILGSIRTIRDFTEGPSLLRPIIQDAVKMEPLYGSGVVISRLWLDNVTTSTFALTPYDNIDSRIEIVNNTLRFGAGFYKFQATLDYPQLSQLTSQQVLNNQSQALISQQPAQTTSLSFLSYSEKLLAGAWRFLTYFGRDSMISALLLEPVLSSGNASALEAVIIAVLERINRTDGSVCHEETIGDYATYLNLQNNSTSSAPGFTYPMIDTDYFLPIIMASYLEKLQDRIEPLLTTQAGSINIENRNLTYRDLAFINAEKIMNITAAFERNQTITNLIHLKEGEVVGQWRDSTYGLANGRIPFDVNCALVPAALRAISTLASLPGVFQNTSGGTITSNWSVIAAKRARVWDDSTLQFFEYNLTQSTAAVNLDRFVHQSTFYSGPSNSEYLNNISSSDGTIIDYALAINSTEAPNPIPVLHTDTAFRLFLLNTTQEPQLTRFLNATANSILRPFPAGLTTPVGLIVANPALSGEDTLIANFTNSAYHGTVVWSWQLALMAKGLERQLARCNSEIKNNTVTDATNKTVSSSTLSVSATCQIATTTTSTTTSSTSTSTTTPNINVGIVTNSSSPQIPQFCTDIQTYNAVKQAYNTLWDVIEANQDTLQSEVWSWTYDSSTGQYTRVALGSLPPPPGVSAGTESNVRQLWSLTFLAVTRNEAYR